MLGDASEATRSKLLAKKVAAGTISHDVVRQSFASHHTCTNSHVTCSDYSRRSTFTVRSRKPWTTITMLSCRPLRRTMRRYPQTCQQTQANRLGTSATKPWLQQQKHRSRHLRQPKLLGRRLTYSIMALRHSLQCDHPPAPPPYPAL